MKDLWAARKPRERFMIVLCVLVVIVGGWLAISPANGVTRKLIPSAEAKKQCRATQAQVASMKDDALKLQHSLDASVFSDPPERLVPKVVRILQDRAKDAGIHLREIKPLRARRAGNLTRVPMSVRFTTVAFAPSVIRFLYDLEDPAQKLAVEKFTVTATDPKSRTVDVEVSVVLFTRGGSDAGQT